MEDILKIAAENPIIPVVKLERAEDATHLLWATGGSLMPQEVAEEYLSK